MIHLDTRGSTPTVHRAGIYSSKSLTLAPWDHAALLLKEDSDDFDTAKRRIEDMIRQCDHYAWLRPYLFPRLQTLPH